MRSERPRVADGGRDARSRARGRTSRGTRSRRAATGDRCPGTRAGMRGRSTPLWVAPSGPTIPARSRQKTTGTWLSATSWKIWSNARWRKVEKIAQTGCFPAFRSPDANATPCCSQIPTSCVRSGKCFWNLVTPVLSGIAAVMTWRSGSTLPRAIAASAKMLLQVFSPWAANSRSGGADGSTFGETPWKPIGSEAARHVALPLVRDHVEHDEALVALQVREDRDQVRDVVAVDRAEVSRAERLEERAARRDGLEQHLLRLLERAVEPRADERDRLQELVEPFLRLVVERAGADAREVLRERADRLRDRHLVVVQDHEQVALLDRPGVVQRLEGDAGRDRRVADDRDGAAVVVVRVRDRVTERGRDARPRVREQVVVVGALLGRRVAREPVALPDRREAVAAARQDLVRVGLVRDVPDEDVLQEVERRSGARS